MNNKINRINNNKFPLRMFIWAIIIGIIFTFAMTYDNIRQTALNAEYAYSSAQEIALKGAFVRSLIFVPIIIIMTYTPMFIAWKYSVPTLCFGWYFWWLAFLYNQRTHLGNYRQKGIKRWNC